MARSLARVFANRSSKSFISLALPAAAGRTGLGTFSGSGEEATAGPEGGFDDDDDEDTGVEGIDASGTDEEGTDEEDDDVEGGGVLPSTESVTGEAIEEALRPSAKVPPRDLGSM